MICFGCGVSIVFWIPKLVDRNRLKELLGRRYPVIYFIYLANGPLLLGLGIFLFIRFH